jgi:hypothetical protein
MVELKKYELGMNVLKITNMEKINIDELNMILSDTLRQLINKEISLKKAGMIAKIAGTLSKNIASTELKERLDLLENTLVHKH